MNLDVYCIAECLATCAAQNSSRLLRVAKSLLRNWPSGCTEKNTSRCASWESTMSKLAMICYDAFTNGHKIHKDRDTMQITSSDSLAWWSNISSGTSWNLCWKTPFWKHGGYWYIHIFNVFHTSISLIFDILLPHIAASTWHCAKDPHNLTSVHPGEELKIQRPEIGEGLMASVLPIWKRINPTLRRNAWVKVDRTATKR